ncbi:cytochrome-c peroxidase [candidate division KSB1 bacterium]
MTKLKCNLMLLIFTGLVLFGGCKEKQSIEMLNTDIPLTRKQELGKLIFHDKNLSTPPGQACVDCHAPEAGFGDPNKQIPVSRGVHPDRFGNRNDLTAAYAGFSPELHFDAEEGLYIGGQFWDGRAETLEEQAKGPFLNPLEMANPDEKAVVDKIRNADYAALFIEVFGESSLDDIENAYNFTAEAIAEYERSPELNKFNSKYDLFLDGKVTLTESEKRGLELFNDENKGNCAACHPSQPGDGISHPLFTDYSYDNLGVPKNPENPFYYLSEELNPDGLEYVDLGLGGFVNKKEENGKFKVPTLRNVEKTAPYLHNGYFDNLRDVIVFYNTRDIGPWPAPEYNENVNVDELGDLKLTEQEIDDILAFLKTLSDDFVPNR